jgi:SAM-dependent methyltransferase
MQRENYLMEDEQDALRLELKTDPAALRRQARWAGARPGMRLGDFGCGPGKTSFHLNRLVQPGGAVVGIEIAPARVAHARAHYAAPGIEYVLGDIREDLAPHGAFDFIWVRFVLEHYRTAAFEIVRNAATALKPGGILCLADLDHNCLGHWELPPRLEKALHGLMARLEARGDFDPYVGRKLYAFLYDLGFADIKVNLFPHHLIHGQAKKSDLFNWTRKVEIAARNSGYAFAEFADGYDGFLAEFRAFFHDPRRFTYSPLICCRGRKPA